MRSNVNVHVDTTVSSVMLVLMLARCDVVGIWCNAAVS